MFYTLRNVGNAAVCTNADLSPGQFTAMGCAG